MLNKPQIKQNTPLKSGFPLPEELLHTLRQSKSTHMSLFQYVHTTSSMFSSLMHFVFAHLNYANPPGLSLTQTDPEAYLVSSQVMQEQWRNEYKNGKIKA